MPRSSRVRFHKNRFEISSKETPPTPVNGNPCPWLRLGFLLRNGFLDSRNHFLHAVAVSRFGQNVVHEGVGRLRVGEALLV